MRAEYTVVVDHDAGGFLPAMLEGEQPVISARSDVTGLAGEYAEDAALLSQFPHGYLL